MGRGVGFAKVFGRIGKTDRQVTFSSDLIYDVLRQHQPDHILLEAARSDAGEGLLDIRRLSDALSRIEGHLLHKKLDRISPFGVPLMLEIGKVPVNGQALDSILDEVAGEGLLREAVEGGYAANGATARSLYQSCRPVALYRLVCISPGVATLNDRAIMQDCALISTQWFWRAISAWAIV